MVMITDGQCGRCRHFAVGARDFNRVIEVRIRGVAPETMVERCGHPQFEGHGLLVTAHSACRSYEPAESASDETEVRAAS